MLVVPCGVWQSRHTVAHEPYVVPRLSDECVLCAWQSEQSWLESSRTSSRPSPVPAALTTMPTGAELIHVPASFRACATSV
jgi:hypothetical protein